MAARARGRVGGRPKSLSPQAEATALAAETLYRERKLSVAAIARQSRFAWRWTRNLPASFCPAIYIRHSLIDKLLHIRVGHVHLRGKLGLMAAFLCKVGATRIWHPNLYRAKSCFAQCGTVFLNA